MGDGVEVVMELLADVSVPGGEPVIDVAQRGLDLRFVKIQTALDHLRDPGLALDQLLFTGNEHSAQHSFRIASQGQRRTVQ
jgi:hypothetical protein